jgi:hypothetical protein
MGRKRIEKKNREIEEKKNSGRRGKWGKCGKSEV